MKIWDTRKLYYYILIDIIMDVMRVNYRLLMDVMQKSTLFGVSVEWDWVKQVANTYGCNAGQLLFPYLGIPLGVNINIIDVD